LEDTLLLTLFVKSTLISSLGRGSYSRGPTVPYGLAVGQYYNRLELGFEKGGRLLGGPLNPQDVSRSIELLASSAEQGANELERIRRLLEELLGVKTIVDETSVEVRVVDEKD
jgi:hypothetical protein